MINLHVYHHVVDGDEGALKPINIKLDQLLQEMNSMADNFAALTAAVDAMEATVNSTAVVLAEVKTALDAAISAGSLEQLKDVSARIEAITNKLRDAATAADVTPETPVA